MPAAACSGSTSAALQARPTWEQVIDAVEQVRGQPWETIRDLAGDWARDLALYLARCESGLKLAALAEKVGVSRAAVSMALSRLQARLTNQKNVRKALAAAQRLLGTNSM